MWTHTQKKRWKLYLTFNSEKKLFFCGKKYTSRQSWGETSYVCSTLYSLSSSFFFLLEIASSLSPLQQSLAERGGKQALIPPPLFLSRQHFFHSNQEGKEGWSREWVSVNVCEWERERERSLGHAHTHARTRKRKGGGSVLTKDIWLTWRTTTLQDLNLDILA